MKIRAKVRIGAGVEVKSFTSKLSFKINWKSVLVYFIVMVFESSKSKIKGSLSKVKRGLVKAKSLSSFSEILSTRNGIFNRLKDFKRAKKIWFL